MSEEGYKRLIDEKEQKIRESRNSIDVYQGYIKDSRKNVRRLQEEISELKREHTVAEGVYVKVKEGKRKFLILEDLPEDLVGYVKYMNEVDGVLTIQDLKTNKVYEDVGVDNVIKVRQGEYKKYLYEDLFKQKGREYLEYQEGDIVVHSKTGEVRIVKEFEYEGSVRACRYNIQLNGESERSDLYLGSWLPLYFKEDMVGEGILDGIKGLKGIYF